MNNTDTIKSVIEGGLWVHRFMSTETLTILNKEPHKYDSNKAKVKVLISTNKDSYEDCFSQEYLLMNYTRAM